MKYYKFVLNRFEIELGNIRLPLEVLPPIDSIFLLDILKDQDPDVFNEITNNWDELKNESINHIIDKNNNIIGYQFAMYVNRYSYTFVSNPDKPKSMLENRLFEIWLDFADKHSYPKYFEEYDNN